MKRKSSKTHKEKVASTAELHLKRQRIAFKNKIRNIFTGAGFKYIPTNDHEMVVGLRKIEVDSLYIYENVWLICEDTVKTSEMIDHIRTKNEAAGEILKNIPIFIKKLLELFPEYLDILNQYNVARLKVFFLYIPKYPISMEEGYYELFGNLKFIEPKTLEYFHWLVKGIKHSARSEFFRFLGLKRKDLGFVSSSLNCSEITAPIIYPNEFTGLKNKVRVVSFMMSAEDLLETGYVLRKDNWEDSIWLYQRLIDNKKLKNVREFIEKKGEAFYNNIIVALPSETRFIDATNHYRTIDEINPLEDICRLVFPKEFNSICIIDGQHRIWAHYESGIDNAQEQRIATLRKQLHLLVTGLVFPDEMRPEERLKIQSEIFLDINSNAKSVPPNVLLQIKRINNPIADESIAQFVVEKLNKKGVFQNMLQISSLDTGRIKTASIVRFALKYLVTVTPSEGKKSLFEYWNGDREAVKRIDDTAIKSYVEFCANVLRNYFAAIKNNFKKDWEDENSKLLTVTSVNGFIIALTRQLGINGVHEFDFYDSLFKKWDFDFSKESFRYASSQYRKFSTVILITAFGVDQEIVETL